MSFSYFLIIPWWQVWASQLCDSVADLSASFEKNTIGSLEVSILNWSVELRQDLLFNVALSWRLQYLCQLKYIKYNSVWTLNPRKSRCLVWFLGYLCQWLQEQFLNTLHKLNEFDWGHLYQPEKSAWGHLRSTCWQSTH